MALWLEQKGTDFETRFGGLLAAKREVSTGVNQVVAEIVERVRRNKDAGLIDLTLRYDRADLRKLGMRVMPQEVAAARSAVDAKTLAALELAARPEVRLDRHRVRIDVGGPYPDVHGRRQTVAEKDRAR